MAAVKFLPPLAPEKQAYALARYSRSADPVEDSLAWVDRHSEEKFWETFYFDYGHASIADLGHVAVCFEGLSELAALEVLDEQLWDGQARSTRYQDFSTCGHVTPPELAGHPLEVEFREAVALLLTAYRDVHDRSVAWLTERYPRPADMKAKPYERNVAARAFDMARYLLPLAIPTNIGQVVSVRTLERQISRLLVSDLEEVRRVAQRLVEGCRSEPLGGGKPSAPTLARHAEPDAFRSRCRERAREVVAERFPGDVPPTAAGAWLQRRREPAVELLTGLLYEASRLPWDDLAAQVETLPAGDRAGLVRDLLSSRGRHDELPRAARAGHAYVFELIMDVGGWRDMHRHRRCQQHLQEFDLEAGWELPPDAEEAGISGIVLEAYDRALLTAQRLAEAFDPRLAAYVLPLMHRIRCVFKMDFAEIDYIVRLRTGVKGHPSYRRIAWQMYREIQRAEPHLATLIEATPPDVEDPLTR